MPSLYHEWDPTIGLGQSSQTTKQPYPCLPALRALLDLVGAPAELINEFPDIVSGKLSVRRTARKEILVHPALLEDELAIPDLPFVAETAM